MVSTAPRFVHCISTGLKQGKGHLCLGLSMALRAGLLALHPKERGAEAAGLKDGEQGSGEREAAEQVGCWYLGSLQLQTSTASLLEP